MKNCLETSFQTLPRQSKSRINRGYRRLKDTDLFQQVVGFTCMLCHSPVNSDPLLSGVNNRNHCPYCLTSKHVDLFRAGDRLNACKGSMQAVGLAWKRSQNKYGSQFGELMIIHLCDECDSVSFNRIAADDDSEKLVNLFARTVVMNNSTKARFQQSGFHLLEAQHQQEFVRCLFGSVKLKIADYF